MSERLTDRAAWRLEIRLSGETASRTRRPARAPAVKVLAELRRRLPDDVAIDRNAATVVVRAFKNEQIEDARRQLDVILREIDATASVRVAHRAKRDGGWTLTERGYHAPRTKHAGRRGADPEPGRRPLLSRRAKVRWVAGFSVAAVAGASYYALWPGVASYQIGFTLTLPLIVVVLFWLHRRLPSRLQWALAITLAVIGPTAYLIYGGSQWWAWSQVAVLPFVFLLIGWAYSRNPAGFRRGPWYGGIQDRPWGPP